MAYNAAYIALPMLFMCNLLAVVDYYIARTGMALLAEFITDAAVRL